VLDSIAQMPAAELFEVDLRRHQEATHAALRRVGQVLGGRHTTRRLVVLRGPTSTAAEST
jgi:hypothetical protein